MWLVVLALCAVLPAEGPPPTSLLVLTPDVRHARMSTSAELFAAVMAGELRKRPGYQVTTLRDVEGTLSPDQRRRAAGCDNAACAAEIAGVLNRDEVVVGSLGPVGFRAVVLSFSRVQAKSGVVLGRSERRLEGKDEGAALTHLESMAVELFETAGERPGDQGEGEDPRHAVGRERVHVG